VKKAGNSVGQKGIENNIK